MDDQREREIALGLREGRPEAWHALYDEFAPKVWQAASRWLGPRHAEIGDIVQETFMAAAGAARGYDSARGSLATWLGGIARNKLALYFRKHKRHERLDAGPDGAAAAGRLMLWLEDREFDPAAALEAAELGWLCPGDPHRVAGRLRDAAGCQIRRRREHRTDRGRRAIDARRHPLEARQGKAGLSRTVCENDFRLFLGQRGARAMTNPDHNFSEQRLAELLRAAQHPATSPDEQFLARLREESTAEFISSHASPPRERAEDETTLSPRKSKMFIIVSGALAATAAAVVLMVTWFFASSSGGREATLASVLEKTEQASSLHVRIDRAAQLAVKNASPVTEAWSAKAGQLRVNNADGTYAIAQKEKLWKIDEKANRAASGESPYYRAETKSLDLLPLVGLSEANIRNRLLAATALPVQETIGGKLYDVYRYRLINGLRPIVIEAQVDPATQLLHSLETLVDRDGKMTPAVTLTVVAANQPVNEDLFVVGDTLTEDGRIGKVSDVQGMVSIKPVMAERWTPVCGSLLLRPGDWLRTDLRGANAVAARLTSKSQVIAGPGTLIELIGPKKLRLYEGEIQLTAAAEVRWNCSDPATRRLYGPSQHGPRLSRPKLPSPAGRGEPASACERRLQVAQGFPGHGSAGFDRLAGGQYRRPQRAAHGRLPQGDGRYPRPDRPHDRRRVVRQPHRRQSGRRVLLPLAAGRLDQRLRHVDRQRAGRGRHRREAAGERNLRDHPPRKAAIRAFWNGKAETSSRPASFPSRPTPRSASASPTRKSCRGPATASATATPCKATCSGSIRLRELSIDVKINSVVPLARVASPTHAVRTAQTEHSAHVEFDAQEYTPTRDFEVVAELQGKQSELTLIPHRRGDDGYFMLLLAPPAEDTEDDRDLLVDKAPVDLILLADTSASMDARQRAEQAEFIAAMLGSLTPRDTVNLACCDVNCDWVFEKAVSADAKNVRTMRQFLDRRTSLGWTDLPRAFSQAFQHAGRNTCIVYVGDGIPTTGDADPAATAAELRRLYNEKCDGVPPLGGMPAKAGTPTCHAVSVGSTFESGVLEGHRLAGRRLDAANQRRTRSSPGRLGPAQGNHSPGAAGPQGAVPGPSRGAGLSGSSCRTCPAARSKSSWDDICRRASVVRASRLQDRSRDGRTTFGQGHRHRPAG